MIRLQPETINPLALHNLTSLIARDRQTGRLMELLQAKQEGKSEKLGAWRAGDWLVTDINTGQTFQKIMSDVEVTTRFAISEMATDAKNMGEL